MKKLKEILFLQNLNRITRKTIFEKYWSFLVDTNDLEELKIAISNIDNKYSNNDICNALFNTDKQYDEIINQKNLNVITIFDEEYPTKLNVMNNKRPLIIYARGNTRILTKSNVAIVGTRQPSERGRKIEEGLVKEILKLSDRVIVSGLALGCDTIAHETTLKVGKETLAVLPSGLNEIVPSSNLELANEIIKKDGCIISEYNCNAKVEKSTYIQRNAVVAALSDITIVVECDVKSGTMYTVDAARRYKRQVYCYYPKNEKVGMFEGNKYIVEKKGGIRIKDTESLKVALDNNKNVYMKQMSLLDFL